MELLDILPFFLVSRINTDNEAQYVIFEGKQVLVTLKTKQHVMQIVIYIVRKQLLNLCILKVNCDGSDVYARGICREPDTENDQLLIKWQRRRRRLPSAHFASSLLTIEICIDRRRRC